MTNDPLFDDPQQSKRIADDPQITAIVLRSHWIRLVVGLVLLAVLAAILLMSIFR